VNIETVLHVIGRLCAMLAVALCAPLALAVTVSGLGAPVTQAFIVSAAVSLGLGYALRLSFSWDPEEFGLLEAFAAVTLGWIVFMLLGALPYVITGQIPSLLDACLETLSGATTTGATVLEDPSRLSLPLLFWRSMTGWLGGMGFLAVAVAILPVLGAGGNFVVDAEISGTEQERIVPRLAGTARRVWPLYLAFTLVMGGGFWWAGMSPFDGLCHAMAVVSTGSFTTTAEGLAGASAAAQWLAIGGLFLAGLNVLLLRQLLLGRPMVALRNTELRVYLVLWLLLAGGLALAADALPGLPSGAGTLDRTRQALLVGTSSLTTSGLDRQDVGGWPPLLQALLLMVIVLGASSGSTAGGIKVFRLVLLARVGVREVGRLMRPAAVLVVKVGRRMVDDTRVLGVSAFVVLHLIVTTAAAFVLMLLGLDLQASVAGVLSALSNYGGPQLGFGTGVTWMELAPLGKLVLMACMLLGRLEFLAIFVLLVPLGARR
jgi:trk system potassium uptake protein TrkH